jgi:hypothetical protein
LCGKFFTYPPIASANGERNRRQAAPAFLGECRLRTCVYIDAFNLYYGALKGTPYRWLDLEALCRNLLPRNEIVLIRYFTALVKARPNDLDQSTRQQFYLRALRTLPLVNIHLGRFLSNRLTRPLASLTGYADIIDTVEKGSDVNLATYLIHDGHRGMYDVAVVITNDSDLVEPVRIVRDELNRTIGVINPHSHASQRLRQSATFYGRIRQGILRDSQFPDIMSDSKGAFHKPPTW